MIDLVKYPILTKKSCELIEQNKYSFDVDSRLTKKQIKQIFEKLFNVNILSINTHLLPIKKKKLSFQHGYKVRYKRTIITIKSNEQIPIFDN